MRPNNHCWCDNSNELDENGRSWKDKSRARRPTYGSCIFCYDAGPVGQKCVKCSINGKKAGYWMIVRGEDPKKYLGSIRLAKIFGGKTVIAKAGHCYFQNEGNHFYKLDNVILKTFVSGLVANMRGDIYDHKEMNNKIKMNFHRMVGELVYTAGPVKDNMSVLDASLMR